MQYLDYYRNQSAITDPAEFEYLYTDLPSDMKELCEVVRGLIIHYQIANDVFEGKVPKHRLADVDARTVANMLERILDLDRRSLTVQRAPEDRIAGCCRDFSTLFCSMARHQGIPVRTRVGFATYFNLGFYLDHEVVEYWDQEQQRWRLVDPWLGKVQVKASKIDFDVFDIPRDKFITAGRAWQVFREGDPQACNFGDRRGDTTNGWRFIGSRLIQDLAALNKMELLLWDSWGLMAKDVPTSADLRLLDHVAEATLSCDGDFEAMRDLYQHKPGLKVPPVIMSYSPVAPWGQVSVPAC